MESSTEQVRQEETDRSRVIARSEDERLDLDGAPDHYAQSELETRLRRIEVSIERARQTT